MVSAASPLSHILGQICLARAPLMRPPSQRASRPARRSGVGAPDEGRSRGSTLESSSDISQLAARLGFAPASTVAVK